MQYSIIDADAYPMSSPKKEKAMVDNFEFEKVKARVALLERQVEFLLAQLKLQYVDRQPVLAYPDVAELKRQGKLIEAITLYRSKTDASLMEAKMFVESMII